MSETVEREALKGNVSAQIAVLASNIKIFTEDNKEDHKRLFILLGELTKHVNHEIEDIRAEIKEVKTLVINLDSIRKGEIDDLNDCRQITEAQRRGEMKAYKVLASILGIALTIVSIAWYIRGLF
jgi:hypothetical protein